MIQMQYKARGEIAVFLAMLIGVVSLFITTILGQIRKNVCKSDITIAMDAAVRSCFAEYNERLFKEYGIMCIDTSYKTDSASMEVLKDHFTVYMEENLRSSSVYFSEGMKITDVSITGTEFISDRKEEYVERLKENENVQSLMEDYVRQRYEERDESVIGPAMEEEYEEGYREEPKGTETEDEISEAVKQITDDEVIDIINSDIRENGSPGFDLLNCVIFLEIRADVTDGESDHSITGSYGY